MNLSDAIQLYLADRGAKGIKASTIRNDRVTLNKLLAEVGNLNTKSLRPQHMDRYWNSTAHFAPASKNRAKAQLSSFFKWLQVRGHMDRHLDLLEGVPNLREPKNKRLIIPAEEFSTFLAGIKDPRHRIVAAISLYLFTRISETRSLRWQDFDLDGEKPTVDVYREKTGELDTLPVCEELIEELRRWRRHYGLAMGEPPRPGWLVVPGCTPPKYVGVKGRKGGLVLAEHGAYQPTQKPFLGTLITSLLKRAGYYQPKEGGHTFRRSGAIALYHRLADEGHDRALRIVQAMLGHGSLRTTEIYLRLDVDLKLRNDLLAGKPMFPKRVEADVIEIPIRKDGAQ